MNDQYQSRYVEHQKRKRGILIDIMRARHSDRMFDDKPVDNNLISELIDAAMLAPSSCDRHGVHTSLVTNRDDKALLGGILVGGVGWIHRAPVIILLMGSPSAYKAPGEIDFMPYLDGGVAAQNILLAATAAGLAATFCNPAIRDAHKPFFQAAHGTEILCGAVAVGHPLPPSWIFDTSLHLRQLSPASAETLRGCGRPVEEIDMKQRTRTVKNSGKRTVSKRGYKRYITSPQWRAKRQEFIDSPLPKMCRGCGKPWGRGDHLHHQTYDNLGNEDLRDIVPVCERCHKQVHIVQKNLMKFKGMTYEHALTSATRRMMRMQRMADRKVGKARAKEARAQRRAQHAATCGRQCPYHREQLANGAGR